VKKNKYESISELFINYLQKYYGQQYNNILNSMNSDEKSLIREKNKSQMEIGKELCLKNNIDYSKMKAANNLTELDERKNEMKLELEKANVKDAELALMNKFLNSSGNTNFGTRNEINVIRNLETDTGKQYRTGLSFSSKFVAEVKSGKGNLEIEIGGKGGGIDGFILLS
jgi:hypothetical protein